VFETNGGNEGVYPCCGQRVLNFDVSNKSAAARQGCCARNHVVRAEGGDAQILDTMLKRHSLVTISFDEAQRLHDTDVDPALFDDDSDEDEDNDTAADDSTDAAANLAADGDGGGGGAGLNSVGGGVDDGGGGVTDEDSMDSLEWGSDADEDSDTDMLSLDPRTTKALQSTAVDTGGAGGGGAGGGGASSGSGAGGRRAPGDSRETITGAPRPIPAHLNILRRRQWQQDVQRETDAERMTLLCDQLMTMRRVPRRSERGDVKSETSKSRKSADKRQAGGRKAGSNKGGGVVAGRGGTTRASRPSSAQAFMAVRRQAQERRKGAGNW